MPYLLSMLEEWYKSYQCIIQIDSHVGTTKFLPCISSLLVKFPASINLTIPCAFFHVDSKLFCESLLANNTLGIPPIFS